MSLNVYDRLSEISDFTVGIIEAGEYRPDDPRILVRLPLPLMCID